MKGVCLLSGGIDSAVAAYLMDQKAEMVLLNLNINPKRKEKAEKIKKIAEILGIKLYSTPYDWVQRKIAEKADNKYICIICKRLMLKAAEKFCKERELDFIITGESLGQVASQTLDNLAVLDSAVDLPVFRPLLGWNKEEIVRRARGIGTYEISTVDPHLCGIVPDSPATSADLEKVEREEQKLKSDKILKRLMKELELKWKL